MRFGNLMKRAKVVVDKRGGTDALKQDAGELKDIAKGQGTFKDKAKAAGQAIKQPGAEQPAESPPPPTESTPEPPAAPEPPSAPAA